VCPVARPCPKPPDPRHFGLPAGIDTALWVRLDSLTQQFHDPTGGILGARVVRTRDSAVVWSHHPDLRTLPASTMKVLTTMAALEDLGPDFRWQTRVWSTGPIQGGVLKGDLILEGGGDPTLGVDGGGMGPLVNAVARAGIRTVQGRLIALDTIVGRERDVWPQGWTFGNSRDGYGAPVAGLNWGQNRGGKRSIAEPRRLALAVFSKSLSARKIKVSGTDTTIWARGDTTIDRRRWELVGKTSSPRLAEVMRICLIHSVNPYAEAAVLALGLRRPNSRFSPRDQGKRRYRQILTTLGAPASVAAEDGSGLSRYDLVTARAMTDLLRRDMGRADGLRATDLMAVGGQGTLRHRFGRLPSRSMVSAKTGTLDGTCTLVGLLRVPGRDTLAFAFLSTGFQGGASRIRGFQDRLLMSLAGLDLRPVDSTVPLDTLIPDDEDPTPESVPASVTPVAAPPEAIAPLPDTTSPPIAPTADSSTLPPAPTQAPAPVSSDLPDSSGIGVPLDTDSTNGPARSAPSAEPDPSAATAPDTTTSALPDTGRGIEPALPVVPPEAFTPPPTPPDLGPVGAPPPPPSDTGSPESPPSAVPEPAILDPIPATPAVPATASNDSDPSPAPEALPPALAPGQDPVPAP